MSFLRLQGYAALLFCVLYRSNCCCRSFFRFEQMHSQSPQRQQIQIKRNSDTAVRSPDGSQWHSSCNGPGDHGRYGHHRIFQVQGKRRFLRIVFPAQLAGEHDGKGLVAGDGGSDNGSQ